MILLIIPLILYADLKHNQHSCDVIFINLRSKEDIFCTNYHPLQSHFTLWFLYCCVLLKATLCLYSLFFSCPLKKLSSWLSCTWTRVCTFLHIQKKHWQSHLTPRWSISLLLKSRAFWSSNLIISMTIHFLFRDFWLCMYHAPVHKLKFWGHVEFVYYGWEQLSIFIYNCPLGPCLIWWLYCSHPLLGGATVLADAGLIFFFFLQLGNRHKFISVYWERGDNSAKWNPWESEPLASVVNLCFVFFLKTNLIYIAFIWWWKICCVYSNLWLGESDNI